MESYKHKLDILRNPYFSTCSLDKVSKFQANHAESVNNGNRIGLNWRNASNQETQNNLQCHKMKLVQTTNNHKECERTSVSMSHSITSSNDDYVPSNIHSTKQPKFKLNVDATPFVPPCSLPAIYENPEIKQYQTKQELIQLLCKTVEYTNWTNIQQIPSTKTDIMRRSMKMSLRESDWQFQCKKSLKDCNLPWFPWPMNATKDNARSNEWIKIVHIKTHRDIYIALSFKRIADKWEVKKIYLDPTDVYVGNEVNVTAIDFIHGWICKHCTYNNRKIMVNKSWRSYKDSVHCGLCGSNRCYETGNIINKSFHPNYSYQSKNETVQQFDEDDWSKINNKDSNSTINCNLNKKEQVYLENCDAGHIIRFMEEIIDGLDKNGRDGKIFSEIRNDIICYCRDNNITGKALLALGRKNFCMKLRDKIGNKKVYSPLTRLFTSIINIYSINCYPLKRLCFILNHFQNSEPGIQPFLTALPNYGIVQLLDDFDHILGHKDILKKQPYSTCTQTRNDCQHCRRLQEPNSNSLEGDHKEDYIYISYLDRIHSLILHQDDRIKKHEIFPVYNSGNSIDYLTSCPLFANLKEEITKNEEYCISEMLFQATLRESQHRMKTEYFTHRNWKATKADKKYGIKQNDSISIQHVLAVKLYSDHTKLCQVFRASLSESILHKSKEHTFYWKARFIFEAVQFFGSSINSKDKFFYGIQKKFVFDQFSIKFETPTLTTRELDIARRFVDDSGVILTLSPKYTNLTNGLDVSLFSAFSDEQEQLFSGTEELSIVDIQEYSDNKWMSYKYYVMALLYFQKIVEQTTENNSHYNHPSISKVVQRSHLVPLLKHQMHQNSMNDFYWFGRSTKVEIQKEFNAPTYITALFEHFCISKTDNIDLSCIMKEKEDMDETLYSLLFINDGQEINEETIKSLFPHLQKYRNHCGDWVPLNDEEPHSTIIYSIIDNMMDLINSTADDTNSSTSSLLPTVIPTANIPTDTKVVSRKKGKLFQPKNGYRARLNIFIPQSLTKEMPGKISEKFPDSSAFYYYLDYTTALQVNDKQAKQYNIDSNVVVIINYDIHDKESKQCLYAVIEPNDSEDNNARKYNWKLTQFLDENKILNQYGIQSCDLPRSSREKVKFKSELERGIKIQEKDIDAIKVNNLAQHKPSRKNKKTQSVKYVITETKFKESIKKNLDKPLIPTVKIKDKRHWIEWVLIVKMEEENINFGVSFKRKSRGKICATSICFDKVDIVNKFRLSGANSICLNILSDFKSEICALDFNDNQPRTMGEQ